MTYVIIGRNSSWKCSTHGDILMLRSLLYFDSRDAVVLAALVKRLRGLTSAELFPRRRRKLFPGKAQLPASSHIAALFLQQHILRYLGHLKWIIKTALVQNSVAGALHPPQQRTPIGESVCENSPSKPSTSTKTPISSRTMSDPSNAASVSLFTRMMAPIWPIPKAGSIRPT